MNNFDKENKKNNKRIFLMLIITSVSLVVAIVAASYAYFTATVTNRNNVTSTDVTTAALGIEFTDGPEVALDEAIPGVYVEKTFKVENIGGGDTVYDIYMSDLINNFEDKTDLVYTLISNDGGANITTQTQAPSVSSAIVTDHAIRVGQTHNYTLRIEFKETNDDQNDNKGKAFSTVIRINEVKEALTAVEKITNMAANDNSIVNDGTTDNNLRYVGANPNNYVSFNGELWRIIGVMNNIQTEGGQTTSLLKIIRNESIGEYSWNVSDSLTNDGWGINQWGASGTYEGSALMRELNTDYLGNITIGTDNKWYDGYNNSKETNMPSTKINTSSQSMIENVVWNLGSPNNDNGTIMQIYDDASIASNFYIYERKNTNGKVCESGINCSDDVIRTSTWTGKVGLMYPSDYLNATSGGSTANRNTCMNTNAYYWGDSNVSDCKNNDWLLVQESYQWTMSPSTDTTRSDDVFRININGGIGSSYASKRSIIRPVVFLKSAINIVSGEGSANNPFIIAL